MVLILLRASAPAPALTIVFEHTMRPAPGWTLRDWISAYRTSEIDEQATIDHVGDFDREDPAWISLATASALEAAFADLRERFTQCGGDWEKFPLYGVPIAVKDNIDVVGFETTAACPAFARPARDDAEVVRLLRRSGAIIVGKTNLDQFATGLVGTRSPYGSVRSAFDPAFIGGGSSSGSASVVTRGLVPLALGTDTAGSGRVPAAFQNIVGFKPTRGRFSTRGVVPACRTLDCVSIFSLTVDDSLTVSELLSVYDEQDPFSRARPSAQHRPIRAWGARVGIPESPRFFGDRQAEDAFERAVACARELGARIVPVDMSAFHELAELLYAESWVAERSLVAGALLEKPELLDPTVGPILLRGRDYSARDAFRAEYRRAELARAIERVMSTIDGLMVPTTPTTFQVAQVMRDPVALNSILGTYTNFTNLADLAGIAVPGPMRRDGLPAGVTFLARAFAEDGLAAVAREFHHRTGVPLGATGARLQDAPLSIGSEQPSGLGLVVVGAHMRGMPLAGELSALGGRFLREVRTAPGYRLFTLPGTKPEKPGLCRAPEFQGPGIAVELWDLPHEKFGALLEMVRSPLGLGSVELEDGTWEKGFICEPIGFEGAREITEFGGFRAYVSSRGGGA